MKGGLIKLRSTSRKQSVRPQVAPHTPKLLAGVHYRKGNQDYLSGKKCAFAETERKSMRCEEGNSRRIAAKLIERKEYTSKEVFVFFLSFRCAKKMMKTQAAFFVSSFSVAFFLSAVFLWPRQHGPSKHSPWFFELGVGGSLREEVTASTSRRKRNTG